MRQVLEKQLEHVLLELTKDNQNSDSMDLNRLLREIHAYQSDLEKLKSDLQQKIIRLKKSRNYYQRLYDSAPAAFFILNNQGVILDVNFAGTALMGLTKNQLINSDLIQHVAPEFVDAFSYHRRWSLETDVKQTCELKLIKGDCSSFFARLESTSLAADDNDQPHIQTFITDISDQKQMEGALEVAKTRAADEGMLKQIIYHLLSNAFKFTQDGGEILLSAHTVDCIVRSGRRCGDAKDLKIFQECIKTSNMKGARLSQCAEVAVSDTGIGLNAEDQKYIFEPFKQVDESLNRKHHGTGIGLSLAKNLVELQGGKIWVESAGEKKGSTFRFILPI